MEPENKTPEQRKEEEERFKRDLEALRVNPVFRRIVLRELRFHFLEEISEMASAAPGDGAKHRGVVAFIANFYDAMAGEPIVGRD